MGKGAMNGNGNATQSAIVSLQVPSLALRFPLQSIKVTPHNLMPQMCCDYILRFLAKGKNTKPPWPSATIISPPPAAQMHSNNKSQE